MFENIILGRIQITVTLKEVRTFLRTVPVRPERVVRQADHTWSFVEFRAKK